MQIQSCGYDLITERIGDVTVVRITPGPVIVDELSTGDVEDQLVALAQSLGPCKLLLDFGSVEYVSSIALGALIELHKRLLAAGGQLMIGNVNSRIYEVFEITKLTAFLHVRPD